MSHFNRDSWHTRAMRALNQLVIDKDLITADDLHDVIEDPPNPNQVGAVFNTASAMGLIVDTGAWVKARRGPAKGRRVALWESSYHQTPGVKHPNPVEAYLGKSAQGEMFDRAGNVPDPPQRKEHA